MVYIINSYPINTADCCKKIFYSLDEYYGLYLEHDDM